MTIRVATIQAEPKWLNLEAGVNQTIAFIEEAAAGGAELIAFPETFLPGYPVFLWTYPAIAQGEWSARYHANSMTIDGPEMARIRRAARDNNITVVLGFSERDHGSLYIAQSIIGSEGEILLHRRKLKPTFVERTLFGESDGSGIRVVDTDIGKVGALNCFEHIQPLTKYAMYAQHEQIHVASWPCLGVMGDNPPVSPESILSASQTYALEGGAFVITSSQIMSEEGARVFPDADGGPTPVYTGGGGIAAVFGPNSKRLTAPMDPNEEGVLFADIDLADIVGAKGVIDPVGHYSRPDVTSLRFDGDAHPVVSGDIVEAEPQPFEDEEVS